MLLTIKKERAPHFLQPILPIIVAACGIPLATIVTTVHHDEVALAAASTAADASVRAFVVEDEASKSLIACAHDSHNFITQSQFMGQLAALAVLQKQSAFGRPTITCNQAEQDMARAQEAAYDRAFATAFENDTITHKFGLKRIKWLDKAPADWRQNVESNQQFANIRQQALRNLVTKVLKPEMAIARIAYDRYNHSVDTLPTVPFCQDTKAVTWRNYSRGTTAFSCRPS